VYAPSGVQLCIGLPEQKASSRLHLNMPCAAIRLVIVVRLGSALPVQIGAKVERPAEDTTAADAEKPAAEAGEDGWEA